MNDDLVFAIDYSRILAGVLDLTDDQLPTLLAGTHLTPDQFLAMEGYITWPDQHRIITNALALDTTPGLGLRAGERYSLMTHGLMGVASMACPTVYDALLVMSRYHPTRAQFVQQSLLDTDDHLFVRFDMTVAMDPVGRFLLEALLVSLISTLRFLMGDKVRQVDVSLTLPEPEESAAYRAHVPGTLHFAQPHNNLAIPKPLAALPLPTHDAKLQEWALAQCEQQFHQLQQGTSFTARTLAILRQAPSRALTQDQVAFMLNVSPRTLLRRLREEGATYKDLLDQEQKRLAQYYLDHTPSTIEAIAEQLGYHDQSSFRRAFKRWFGHLPSEYRR